jgi:hypothetical protein
MQAADGISEQQQKEQQAACKQQQQLQPQQHCRCSHEQMLQMIQDYDCWVFDCDGMQLLRLNRSESHMSDITCTRMQL